MQMESKPLVCTFKRDKPRVWTPTGVLSADWVGVVVMNWIWNNQ